MLPPNSIEKISRAAVLIHADQMRSLAEQLHSITMDCVARGQLQSGHRIKALTHAAEVTTANTAEAIWASMREIYEALNIPTEETHSGELNQLFKSLFRKAIEDYPECLNGFANSPNTNEFDLTDRIESAAVRAQFKEQIAIDLYVDKKLNKPKELPQPTPAGAVTVHGNVGILQAGSGNVARIEGGLTQVQQSEMTEALIQAVTAILRAPLPQGEATRLLTAVAETHELAAAPAPEKNKLRQLLDVISTGVQGIAAAPQAYAALSAAIASLGY